MIPITAEYLVTAISGIVAFALLALGVLVYISDRKSLNNRLFLTLSLFTVFWIVAVLLVVWLTDYEMKTLASRSVFGIASLITFCIYHFSYHFPIKNNFKERLPLVLFSSLAMFAASTFTPWVVVVVEKSAAGFDKNVYGSGYYVFAVYFAAFVALSFYTLYSKMRSLGEMEAVQTKFILFGITVASVLAFTTNAILPRLTNSLYVTLFGPSMTLFFLAPTAYAVLRHHVFNLKVIGSEFLTFIIWAFILLRVLISNNLEEFLGNILLLIAVGFFGALLIRSVIKEVNQRERVEKLASDLESANKKLEGLDTARREFLSFASHQLKTPMTIIKGYATLASDPNYLNSPDKMKQIVGKINESTDQMYRLISNFLDARAIEEGKITYIFKPMDIVKLTSSLVEEFKPYAARKGLQLALDCALPSLTVNADETKFRQVIQNLIDNAIKYTEKGWVKVSLEKSNSHLLITVTDSGRGISSDVKDLLFGEFVRDKGAALKTQGTGLGLYIAREIVKAHQGEVWVESEGEGKGSKFIVKLPLI